MVNSLSRVHPHHQPGVTPLAETVRVERKAPVGRGASWEKSRQPGEGGQKEEEDLEEGPGEQRPWSLAQAHLLEPVW